MLRHTRVFPFLISLLVLSSCEDVIELDLDSAATQLVIEGTLDAGTQIATVHLTQTNDFYDQAPPTGVTGAVVLLQNQSGVEYRLLETATGTYTAENIVANPEDQFTLSIEMEGQSYEATATVPQVVPLAAIETLEGGRVPFGGSEEGNIQLSANWEDPAGTENFYRLRSYVDGVLQTANYTVLSDNAFGDGNDFTVPLRERFNENTTVTLELLSTDETYYNYFLQVSSVASEGGAATTPFNPVGNFGSDVLGYFGVFYASALTVEL